MPRFDGTGPMGFGPRTGRGFGLCGYGGRRYSSPRNELSALAEEIKMLEEEIAVLREEKEALEKTQEK
jgi:hypothetical protein